MTVQSLLIYDNVTWHFEIKAKHASKPRPGFEMAWQGDLIRQNLRLQVSQAICPNPRGRVGVQSGHQNWSV